MAGREAVSFQYRANNRETVMAEHSGRTGNVQRILKKVYERGSQQQQYQRLRQQQWSVTGSNQQYGNGKQGVGDQRQVGPQPVRQKMAGVIQLQKQCLIGIAQPQQQGAAEHQCCQS